MTRVVVVQRMWQRRGNAAEWEAKNPILEAGEIGVQLGELPLDPQMFKIGNGITPWSDLAWAGGGGGGDDLEFRVTTTHFQWRPNSSAEWIDIAPVSALKGPPGGPGPAGPPGPSSSCFPTASFDGGTGSIAVGSWCEVFVPFGFEITRWTLVADVLGIIVIDVRAESYTNYPPDAADTLCGPAAPALAGDNRAQISDLSSWLSTDVQPGSVLRFFVVACAGINRATLTLEGVRN